MEGLWVIWIPADPHRIPDLAVSAVLIPNPDPLRHRLGPVFDIRVVRVDMVGQIKQQIIDPRIRDHGQMLIDHRRIPAVIGLINAAGTGFIGDGAVVVLETGFPGVVNVGENIIEVGGKAFQAPVSPRKATGASVPSP